MSHSILQHRRQLLNVGTALTLLTCSGIALAEERDDHGDRVKTATPIEHVIVLIGENRTFDNVFATYVPRKGQTVSNLLSRGIINANGQPGPNWAAARQFQVGNINPVAYFINTNTLKNPNKTAYGLLPSPEVGGVPPKPVTVFAARSTVTAPIAPLRFTTSLADGSPPSM